MERWINGRRIFATQCPKYECSGWRYSRLYNPYPTPLLLIVQSCLICGFAKIFYKKNSMFVLEKPLLLWSLNNVIKPDTLEQGMPNIPAVTSLIYTPIFINPTIDGVMPGYTNSAFGVTVSITPSNQW